MFCRPWQFFICSFVVLLFYLFCNFLYKNKPRLYLVYYHIWCYSSFISISKYKLKHKLNSNSNLIKNTTLRICSIFICLNYLCPLVLCKFLAQINHESMLISDHCIEFLDKCLTFSVGC